MYEYKCDIVIQISQEYISAFFGLVSWFCYRYCMEWTI